MKKSRFTDSQVMTILKQAESGIPVPQLYREHDISSATFYKWRSKYGGMDASMMARICVYCRSATRWAGDLRFKNTPLIHQYILSNFDQVSNSQNPAYQVYKAKGLDG